MIGILAFLLSANGQDLNANQHETALLFKDLCIEGEAKLPVKITKKVSFSKLPSMMRKQLGNLRSPAIIASHRDKRVEDKLISGEYFSLGKGPDKNFLAIEERTNPSGKVQRSCSVASNKIAFHEAVRSLDPDTSSDVSETKSVVGPNRSFRSTPMSWNEPHRAGYYLSVNQLSAGRIMMSSIITGADEVQRVQDEIDELKARHKKPKEEE